MTREEAIDILMDDEYLLYEDDSPYNREAYDMAIKALQEQATLDDVSTAYENGYKQGKFEAQQWIPVSERLPEYDKDVLCYTDAEEFIVGHRVDNWGQDAWITGEFGDGEFNAIAWMPLPSPYTEEEQ